jgi:hypothetical protein
MSATGRKNSVPRFDFDEKRCPYFARERRKRNVRNFRAHLRHSRRRETGVPAWTRQQVLRDHAAPLPGVLLQRRFPRETNAVARMDSCSKQLQPKSRNAPASGLIAAI